MIRHRMKAVCACGALLLATQVVCAAQGGGEIYRARLSVVPLDVAMQANVAGLGQVTATLNGNRLTVTGDASGLRRPRPRFRSIAGRRAFPGRRSSQLTATKATNAMISGSLDLDPQQVEDLKGEQLYVQLNSERAPEGNLRGWLLK